MAVMEPADKDDRRTRVLLVTGMSGAGKSSALKVFEDLGFEAVDNIPLSLLKILLAPRGEGTVTGHGAVAATVDIRTRDFTVDAFLADLAPLMTRSDLDIRLLFFDCEEGALGRRYAETRRRHPLAEDRPLMEWHPPRTRDHRTAARPRRCCLRYVVDQHRRFAPHPERTVQTGCRAGP